MCVVKRPLYTVSIEVIDESNVPEIGHNWNMCTKLVKY